MIQNAKVEEKGKQRQIEEGEGEEEEGEQKEMEDFRNLERENSFINSMNSSRYLCGLFIVARFYNNTNKPTVAERFC